MRWVPCWCLGLRDTDGLGSYRVGLKVLLIVSTTTDVIHGAKAWVLLRSHRRVDLG